MTATAKRLVAALFGLWIPAAGVAQQRTDADRDGVQDQRDRCPNTPAGTPVNADGCPRDADGDGVPDNRDRCANTPAGTPVDANGCPQIVSAGQVVAGRLDSTDVQLVGDRYRDKFVLNDPSLAGRRVIVRVTSDEFDTHLFVQVSEAREARILGMTRIGRDGRPVLTRETVELQNDNEGSGSTHSRVEFTYPARQGAALITVTSHEPGRTGRYELSVLVPGMVASVRDIDFRNQLYQLPGRTVQLRDGSSRSASEECQLASTHFADLTQDGRDEAIIVLQCSPLQAANPFVETEVIWGFSVRQGRLQLLGTLQPVPNQWRQSGKLGHQVAWIDDGLVAVNSVVGDALCCPSHRVTQLYRWDGRSFVRTAEFRRPWLGAGPPHVLANQCPGEGCQFGRWVACGQLVVRREPGDTTSVAFRLPRGTEFVAEEGNIHVDTLGAVVVRRRYRFTTPAGERDLFDPGDTLRTVVGQAGGTWTWLYRGAAWEGRPFWTRDSTATDTATAVVVRDPADATWWVRILAAGGGPTGRTGWIRYEPAAIAGAHPGTGDTPERCPRVGARRRS